MLKTFKAWLNGNHLEWIGDRPDLEGKMIQVHVTLIGDRAVTGSKTRGYKMAEILEKLATIQVLDDVDPTLWQQEIRQDRSLPER